MKEKTEYKGKRFFSETEGILGEDGYWKIISGIGESRSKDGEDWETLFMDAMALNKDFEEGYSTALGSVLAQFMAKTHERGFDNLFDAEDYDEALKAKLAEKEELDEANSKSTKIT